MEMPKLTPQHTRLKALAGEFVSKETIHPMDGMPKGAEAASVTHSKMGLDGFALIQDYEQKIDGKIVFRGHGVMRYDTRSKKYELHWFDNMAGPVSVMRGDFKDNHLMLSGKDYDGRPMRLMYDLHKGGGYYFEVQMRNAARQWATVMEGDVVARGAQRKKTAARKTATVGNGRRKGATPADGARRSGAAVHGRTKAARVRPRV